MNRITKNEIKVYRQNKKGLKGRFKIMGQIVLGVVISGVMLTQDDIIVRMDKNMTKSSNVEVAQIHPGQPYVDVYSYMTNVPFLKRNQLDYSKLLLIPVYDITSDALIFIPL